MASKKNAPFKKSDFFGDILPGLAGKKQKAPLFVEVEESVLAEMKDFAKENDQSQSEVVETAIKLLLKSNEKPKKSSK